MIIIQTRAYFFNQIHFQVRNVCPVIRSSEADTGYSSLPNLCNFLAGTVFFPHGGLPCYRMTIQLVATEALNSSVDVCDSLESTPDLNATAFASLWESLPRSRSSKPNAQVDRKEYLWNLHKYCYQVDRSVLKAGLKDCS